MTDKKLLLLKAGFSQKLIDEVENFKAFESTVNIDEKDNHLDDDVADFHTLDLKQVSLASTNLTANKKVQAWDATDAE